jgi:atlastin
MSSPSSSASALRDFEGPVQVRARARARARALTPTRAGREVLPANRPLDAARHLPPPPQIISMADDKTFKLHEHKLAYVLDKVPEGVPVAVVSVVGAFRTGKSFLLDLFLRFLRAGAAGARARGRADGATGDDGGGAAAGADADWLRGDGARLEGNAAAAAPDFAAPGSGSGGGGGGGGGGGARPRPGFKWRFGNERQTTGMWLWSEPFLRFTSAGQLVAVLLMDTQGLFDSKTAQMLTTQIFGLSTLMASYQVFNLTTRLTEAELQNVAVFAEFARIAADGAAAEGGGGGGGGGGGDGAGDGAGGADEAGDAPAAAPAAAPAPAPARLAMPNRRGVARDAKLRELARAGPGGAAAAEAPLLPPVFQRLEFLVRDAVLKSLGAGADACDAEMVAYVDALFSESKTADLRVVREQILTVFEATSCFLLPHPGFEVTENAAFDGAIDGVRREFLAQLARYARVVFCEQLEPKRACGRDLTARDFGAFVRGYARAFADASRFPEARVLFDATTEANNRAAADAALSGFHKALAAATAHATAHVDPPALAALTARARADALALFDALAVFGPPRAVRAARGELAGNVDELAREAAASNAALAPASASGALALAAGAWAALWVLRVLLDFSCGAFFDVCRRASAAAGALQILLFVAAAAALYSSAQGARGTLGALAAGAASLAAAAAAGDGPAAAAAAAAALAPPPAPPAPRAPALAAAEDDAAPAAPAAGLRRRRAAD